jgi:hypothetical protein
MLDGHSAVVWQGTIYIWGGKAEPSSGEVRNTAYAAPEYYSCDLYALDPARCSTQNSADLSLVRISNSTDRTAVPRGRAYHSAAVHGNKDMIITGGLTDDSDTGGEATNVHLHFFDLERRVWQRKTTYGDVPCPRCHHTSLVYGDTLFLHGGYPLLADRRKDITADDMARMQHAMYDVCELNVPTMRWRRIQVSNSPCLWGHTSVLFNRSVIVFGGVDVMENTESGALAVWHSEKKQWRWSDFPDFDHRCAMHTAVEEGSKMYVFGGVSFRTNAKLRAFYEFNLEYGQWRELHPSGSPPLGRIGHAMVAYNGCVFVVGGVAEDPHGNAGSGMSRGRVERVVHVYNIALNEWRTCALASTAPRTDASEDTSRVLRDQTNRTAHRERSWAGNVADPAVGATIEAEWEGTAQTVKDSIGRARAIQQLSDTAMQQLAHNRGAAYPSHNVALRESTSDVIPFDDSRRETAMVESRAARSGDGAAVREHAAAPFMREPPRDLSVAAHEATSDQARREAADDEARRVIEFQQKEIERLKANLEHFQNLSVNGGFRNPYEVPLYNPRSSSPILPPDHNLDPGSSRRRSARDALGDFVPRVNLNVADPPRAVGGGNTGYMSRTAVSHLVASALRSSTAANDATATARASAAAASGPALDPMAYLMQPGAAARAAAQRASGVSSYDHLLARNPVSTAGIASAPYGVSAEHAQAVPITLQPLLGLLMGMPAAAQTAAMAPSTGFVQSAGAPSVYSGARAVSRAPGPSGSLRDDAASTQAPRNRTSLAGLLSGKSSMLSL